MMNKKISGKDELASLIFQSHDLLNVKKIRSLLAENQDLLNCFSSDIKDSVEAAIYELDKIEFTVYGGRNAFSAYF